MEEKFTGTSSRDVVMSRPIKRGGFVWLRRDIALYLMLLPILAYYIIFKYIPMYGVTIAFKDFNVFKGIIASDWSGLKTFRSIFAEPFFWNATRNTVILNLLVLLVNFPSGIILALMLNEVRSRSFKRVAQSLLYLPHFVSWVVVAGLVNNLFSINNGSINMLFRNMGREPVPFLIENGWWMFTYVMANVWKSVGWSTIIYLAAISGVDEELYEAAYIDGANRLQRILYITLPSIKTTIIIMFILSISRTMSIGLDAPLLLQNDRVIGVSEVISTYVYKMGIQRVQYSFATAVGLFQSGINIILLLTANALTRMMGEEGIF